MNATIARALESGSTIVVEVGPDESGLDDECATSLRCTGGDPALAEDLERATFEVLVNKFIKRAQEKYPVDMNGCAPSYFIHQYCQIVCDAISVVKLGRDRAEWLRKDGRYIRAALAAVHAVFLRWQEMLNSTTGVDIGTAVFLAEHVVFPFHDNVVAAHDHEMEDGGRLLFDTVKCRIMFGISHITGERRFGLWYEMLKKQFDISPGHASLACEVENRTADAAAHVTLALQQERMQKVDEMKAKRKDAILKAVVDAWAGSCIVRRPKPKSRGKESVVKNGMPSENERDELRKRLRQKIENRRSQQR